jgi:hypothetical protein
MCDDAMKNRVTQRTFYRAFCDSYGKWHMPQPLIESRDGSRKNVVQYNDYDYSTEQSFFLYDTDERKYDRYLEDAGAGPLEFTEGEQMDPFSGCTSTIS